MCVDCKGGTETPVSPLSVAFYANSETEYFKKDTNKVFSEGFIFGLSSRDFVSYSLFKTLLFNVMVNIIVFIYNRIFCSNTFFGIVLLIAVILYYIIYDRIIHSGYM